MSWILDGSFENGDIGRGPGDPSWRPVNLADRVTMNRTEDSTAKSGKHVLRVHTTAKGGSVAQDVTIPTDRYRYQSSFVAAAWVRTAPTQVAEFYGSLTIWELPPYDYPPNSVDCLFQVGSDWTYVTCVMDPQWWLKADEAGKIVLRVEFYLNTVYPAQLDIDNVSLV